MIKFVCARNVRGISLFLLMFVVSVLGTYATTLSGFTAFSNILGILQGPIGITLGTIAVIGGGAAIVVTKGQGVGALFWVVVGLAIVFGAGTLMTSIFGSAATSGALL